MKYLQDINQISPGNQSNISRTSIKYFQDTN